MFRYGTCRIGEPGTGIQRVTAYHDSLVYRKVVFLFRHNKMAAQAAGVPSGHDWLVGCKLRVTTLSDEEITGEVYTFDPASQALVLRACAPPPFPGHSRFSGSPPRSDATGLPNTSRVTDTKVFDYRVIARKFVKKAEVVAAPTPERVAIGQPSFVDIPELQHREAKAVRQAHE